MKLCSQLSPDEHSFRVAPTRSIEAGSNEGALGPEFSLRYFAHSGSMTMPIGDQDVRRLRSAVSSQAVYTRLAVFCARRQAVGTTGAFT